GYAAAGGGRPGARATRRFADRVGNRARAGPESRPQVPGSVPETVERPVTTALLVRVYEPTDCSEPDETAEREDLHVQLLAGRCEQVACLELAKLSEPDLPAV